MRTSSRSQPSNDINLEDLSQRSRQWEPAKLKFVSRLICLPILFFLYFPETNINEGHGFFKSCIHVRKIFFFLLTLWSLTSCSGLFWLLIARARWIHDQFRVFLTPCSCNVASEIIVHGFRLSCTDFMPFYFYRGIRYHLLNGKNIDPGVLLK